MCYSKYHFVIFEIVGFDAIFIYESVITSGRYLTDLTDL